MTANKDKLQTHVGQIGEGIDHMKTLNEIRRTIKQHSAVLAEKYGVVVVGLFGSYVRGEQGKNSDLDVLAEIVRPISLLELVGAELYLEEILGMKVDLVPKRDVREELRETILAEAVAL
jgi:predicted nucleotidyltransferase